VHQILGLRSFWSDKKQAWDKTDKTFATRGWQFPSLSELLQNLDKHLAQIPADERWDMYYTVAHCGDGKREFREQDVMLFDVDKIDQSIELGTYVATIASGLGVPATEMMVIASGNGLHFGVGLKTLIRDPQYFDANRRHYNAICDKLQAELTKNNLPGIPDRAVFDARRIMRLPGTENRKDPEKPKKCRILFGNIVPQDFDLAKLSGLPMVEAKDQINIQSLKKFPTPDTQAILAGCNFLKFCKEKPNEVSEQLWYAMLSVVARLPPDGRALAHEYSSGHRGYSATETDLKIDQALGASGPRTCGNINGLFGKCAGCPNFEKVNSPVMIQGENYIKTRETGFHTCYIDGEGNIKKGKPCYEDLRRFFEEKHKYVLLGDSKICLTFTGTHWVEFSDAHLENFAQTHFDPTADTKMTNEFKNLIQRTNLRDPEWFTKTTERRMNFANGVLDLDTETLYPHSPEYGFRSVLPYPYDPTAKAPQFRKFLADVMDGREELINVALEFAGYSFSNDRCWAQKGMILTGEGSNGKSTLMDVFKALAGKGNYSSLTLMDIQKETSRKMLDGKLFNLAEETPTYAMIESSVFKNLVSGGETTMRMLYKHAYEIENKTKFIFACNELPRTRDTTRGFFRRLIVVPFDRNFEDDPAKDPFIKQKLMEELPGIFNLVIRGYKRLQKQRGFTASPIIQDQIEQYRTDIDTVRAWYKECVEVLDYNEPDGPEPSLDALYSSYRGFTEIGGDKPENRSTFSRRFSRILPDHKDRWVQKQKAGKRHVCFKGIRYVDGNEF
jgi:putative DNA primase/helicase